jgi:hypothetical protein
MNNDKIVLPEPPNVLKSIRNGFDAITKHLILLVFPVGLDLVLWFAPHLQVKSLIEGLIQEMTEVSNMLPADLSDVMEASQEIWTLAADKINLLVALRSLPVGIFSLLASILPVENPLGVPLFLDIQEPGFAILITLLIFLIGLVLGGFYFSAVRQAALFDELKWRPIFKNWPRVSLQVVILSLIWLVFFLAILTIGSCAATGFTLFSASLGQMVIIMFGLVSFWLIFPLFFSPHGIFASGQKAWISLISSVKMTNLTFLKTSLFILLVLIVNQGLNMVWQVAPEDSWLMLISILGHAFITTGMLSASFVYYQEMVRWMEELKAIGISNPIVEERPTIEK